MAGRKLERRVGERKLTLMEGDITTLAVDAIVNAANERLILGGGVAGAIRTKGGPAIQAECDSLGGAPVGGSAITTAGNLPAGRVIHAVGPRWGEGNEPAKLRSAVISSLELADRYDLKSIAFPAISTGIFGFPVELAAEIILTAIRDHLSGQTGLEEVIVCLFGRESYDVFEKALAAAGL